MPNRPVRVRRGSAGSSGNRLFDNLVGAGEDQGRDGQTESLGGLEIDDQLEGGRQLDRLRRLQRGRART